MALNPNDPLVRAPFVDPKNGFRLTRAGVMFLMGLQGAGGQIDADATFAAIQFANSFRDERESSEPIDTPGFPVIPTISDESEMLALLGIPRTLSVPLTVAAGQATIPFASFLSEDSVTVTGQDGLVSTAGIVAQVYADNDDVYAQDWHPPVIRNIVAGVGFDIVLRPAYGLFAGPVKVNWAWSIN